MSLGIDTIVQRYGRVLGILDIARIRAIIQNLDQEKTTSTFFTDTVRYLHVLKFDRETGQVQPIGIRANAPIDSIHEIANGTYGTIYKTDTNEYIYKEFVFDGQSDPGELERSLRGLFLEIFLQTALGSDDTYGKHICKVCSLYRSENSYTIPKRFFLFLKMEYLPNRLITVLNKEKSMGTLHTIETIRPIFVKVCEILAYFQETYNFHHGDLHIGNIMFSQDSTLQLIDFGMSRMRIKGIEYSNTTPNRNTRPSFDMLIFLSSFLYKYSQTLSPELHRLLQSLFLTNDGTNLHTGWLQPEPCYYHNMYDWIIEKEWPKELRQELYESAERFSPNYIASALQKN